MKLLSLFLFFLPTIFIADEKPLVAIVCSYNNKDWFEGNMASIVSQEYENYKVIYIDDDSTDGTAQSVENYLNLKNIDYQSLTFTPTGTDHRFDALQFENLILKYPHKITIVKNTVRSGALANFYRAAHTCRDEEIILRIDGDDRLNHNRVFRLIHQTYDAENIWLTHGTLIFHPPSASSWSKPVPKKHIAKNTFRKFRCPSHLLTCYAWLYKKVRLEDQLYEGYFIPAAADQAIIFPMIEMAGERHAFLSEPIYVYNTANKLNVNKTQAQLQRDMSYLIRNKPSYSRIPDLK